MTAITTLRATNCTRLLPIAADVVAACSSKTAFLIQHAAGRKTAEATCTAPREADAFAPWLAPGAALAKVRAVWAAQRSGSVAVLAQPAEDTADVVTAVELVTGLTERVTGLHVLFQTVLAVCTPTQVLFYFLDPAPSAAATATRMGACALPAWAAAPSVTVDVTSSACSSTAAAADRLVCVVCAGPERLFTALVACPTSSTTTVLRRTPLDGVALPCGVSAAETRRWAVRWSRLELLVLLAAAGAKAKAQLAGFALQPPADGRELSRWMSADELAASLHGAPPPAAVSAARNVCCDGDGAHVWLCDTTTGPAVALREVSGGAASASSVALSGSKTSARLCTVSGAVGAVALVGCTLYSVQGGVAQASASTPNGASAAPSPASPSPSAAAPARDAGVKEAVLRYVTSGAPALSCVVRDAVYVRVSSQGAWTHDILDRVDAGFSAADDERRGLALLRYASAAQSLHPYTVLRLFHLRRGPSAPAALTLALAVALAEKATLQYGGLQRLPDFAAVSAAFFASAFATDLERKRYAAGVCAAAMSALASGSLGAARLLFAVADRAVALVYGGAYVRASASAESDAADGAEAHACEAVMAEAVSLMRSYVDWSLTASASLGVMTAHVGSPQTLTKEAALRDGMAHPIDTSRQVHIHAMEVARLPKRTL